MVCIFFFNWKE